MEDIEQHQCAETERKEKLDHHGMTNTNLTIPSLEIQNVNTFYCTPCAISSIDHSEFAMHLTSDGHANIILATGFTEEIRENSIDTFAPLYCCMLCNVWCLSYNTYNHHFKNKTHKRLATVMRNMSGSKKQNVIGGFCSCTAKNLSDPYPPLHYCELCDAWCANCKSFRNHLKCKMHMKMNQFIIKISDSNLEMIPDACFGAEISKNSSNSLTKPDYCDLCSTQCIGPESYETHMRGKIHTTIEKLRIKMLDIKRENEVGVCFNAIFSENFENSLSLLKNCKFCHTWFYNSKRYDSHLKSKFHVKIEILKGFISNIDASFEAQTSEASVTSLSLSYHCKSCNIRFNKSEFFDHHLKSAIHGQIKQFIKKMSDLKETNIASVCSDSSSCETVSCSLPLLHYCEICNICYSDNNGDHFKNRFHKRMENYMIKINAKKIRASFRRPFCCELCNIRFKKLESYNRHLQDKYHKRITYLSSIISNQKKKNLSVSFVDAEASENFNDSSSATQ